MKLKFQFKEIIISIHILGDVILILSSQSHGIGNGINVGNI